MKRNLYGLVSLFTVLLVAIGCTPKAIPVPAVSTPKATATATVAAPIPIQEDDAWAKVVAAAKKEGVVTIYSQVFVGDVGRRITNDFTKQFGIRTEILVGSGGTLKEKILVEQAMKHQVADVFNIGGANSTSELVLKGGADKIADELPALKDKGEFKVDPVYSPNGELIVWNQQYTAVVVINTKLVKSQEEPRSFSDLLAPRWKGQMITGDPRVGGATGFWYVMRYYKVLDLDYYRHLAQQDVKLWGGNVREAAYMVGRGEYLIGLNIPTSEVAPLIAEGAPLKILALEEGVAGSPQTILVVKGAPHPNAGRVFVNWLMTPEGQHSYVESSSATSVRKDVPDFVNPNASVSPRKIWPITWDVSDWVVKDQAAKTIDNIVGSK